METVYIEVGDKDWGILINYDFDEKDYDEISAALYSFGMNRRNISKCLNILSSPNSGMTISNSALKMTSIYIGRSTSASEFWNTLNHELFHATVAIIDYYGEPYDEEPAAYLHGEIMRKVVERIGEPCR